MGLFSLIQAHRGRSRSRSRAQQPAPRIEVAYDASGHRGLAFNLAWRSIATGGGRQEALRLARAAGATHAVLRAGQVGMGVLPQPSVRPGARLLPAALVAARQHPGTAVCCLEIAPGEYWLALTIHGAPTSTDLFLSGIASDEALQRAYAVLDSLDVRASATLHTNIPGCTRTQARPCAPADLLEAVVPEGDVLRAMPPSRHLRRWVLGVLLVLAATLAAQQYRSRAEVARRAVDASAAAARPDPQAAWNAAVMRWSAGMPMPTSTALQPVRESLGALPVQWHGWELAQAACRASDLDPGPPARRTWHCDADYRRGPAADLNRDMASRAPAGWSLRFLPLGELQLHRTLHEQAEALRLGDLLPVSHYEVEVASRLQRLSPTFAGDLRLVFAPLPLSPPTDAAGQALGPPSPPVLPLRAAFQVRAPLRSIDALLASGIAAHWQAVHLSYHTPAGGGAAAPASAGAASSPGAASSALMVDLKGEFIARP